MQVGSKLQFTVPDKCPDDCKYLNDVRNFGQSAVCRYCPVFCCSGDSPLIEPEGIRDDWTSSWEKFFNGEVDVPKLNLTLK